MNEKHEVRLVILLSESKLFAELGNTENLKKYVKLLLNHYQVVDGYWFSYVEREYGLESAVRINEEIWSRIATRTAKDIKSSFDIKGKGVERVWNALKLLPWYTITNYEVNVEEDSLVITIPVCLPQGIRAKKNLGEYPCKEMHRRVLENFVKEIDDSIGVTCVFAPPDEHPKDVYCKWIFRPKIQETRVL
jgi:hypothetical protein